MSEVQTTITWSLGTLLTLCTIAGLATKFILVPYLREHLVKPVELVKKQVTENHHSNTRPTVLDRIDDVQQAVVTLGNRLEDDRNALQRHLDWSNNEFREVWKALGKREDTP
ncbi:hypothetical protein CLV56_3999 [Mumia flava]|uniref:Uncharacterized protein n=1 Tax=Mumia flava TaxID=1348852 RepID=A0A0B2BTG5_9ACTN|nr:hypothetical protein [Mumia flava]PJJ48294.1 hypothetical protein CLV56_3999 [Mumia flava]